MTHLGLIDAPTTDASRLDAASDHLEAARVVLEQIALLPGLPDDACSLLTAATATLDAADTMLASVTLAG